MLVGLVERERPVDVRDLAVSVQREELCLVSVMNSKQERKQGTQSRTRSTGKGSSDGKDERAEGRGAYEGVFEAAPTLAPLSQSVLPWSSTKCRPLVRTIPKRGRVCSMGVGDRLRRRDDSFSPRRFYPFGAQWPRERPDDGAVRTCLCTFPASLSCPLLCTLLCTRPQPMHSCSVVSQSGQGLGRTEKAKRKCVHEVPLPPSNPSNGVFGSDVDAHLVRPLPLLLALRLGPLLPSHTFVIINVRVRLAACESRLVFHAQTATEMRGSASTVVRFHKGGEERVEIRHS